MVTEVVRGFSRPFSSLGGIRPPHDSGLPVYRGPSARIGTGGTADRAALALAHHACATAPTFDTLPRRRSCPDALPPEDFAAEPLLQALTASSSSSSNSSSRSSTPAMRQGAPLAMSASTAPWTCSVYSMVYSPLAQWWLNEALSLHWRSSSSLAFSQTSSPRTSPWTLSIHICSHVHPPQLEDELSWKGGVVLWQAEPVQGPRGTVPREQRIGLVGFVRKEIS